MPCIRPLFLLLYDSRFIFFFHLFDACTFVEMFFFLLSIYQFSPRFIVFCVKSGCINQRPLSKKRKKKSGFLEVRAEQIPAACRLLLNNLSRMQCVDASCVWGGRKECRCRTEQFSAFHDRKSKQSLF